MEIREESGLTIVPLPDGRVAIVMVQIAGPKTTAKIADKLTEVSVANRARRIAAGLAALSVAAEDEDGAAKLHAAPKKARAPRKPK